MLERFAGARHQLIAGRFGVLEADLNVVQAGVRQGADLVPVQPHAGGDQVTVITQFAGTGNQLDQIRPGQRFAAGQAQLGRAHGPCLGEHVQPLPGVQLLTLVGKIHRVGAIGALQRATVGQLRQQP